MKPAFFIIPGFGHRATETPYTWLRKHVQKVGYEPKLVPIEWKRKTMENYVDAFLTYYERNHSKQNTILGFSFGAMIAFISASETQPEHLYLCSLSPYFQEDLSDMNPSWKSFMGKRRMQDFERYHAGKIAKQVISPTTIFCGEKEARQFPSLKRRCEEVNNKLKHSRILFPKDAPHQIEFPSYKEAIKQVII